MTRSTSQFLTGQPRSRRFSRWLPRTLTGAAAALFSVLFIGLPAPAQSANSAAASSPNAHVPSAPASKSTVSAAQARARRRAAARRRRLAEEQQAAQQQQGNAGQVGPTPAQRARDAQILAAQKKQSDAIASENDALTQQYVEAQQKQQAEPRIQDAPGPDSTPLPGDPAVMPAQSSNPPVIQDAPGPAQTLPKAPPAPAPAPSPAPQP